MRRLRFVMGRGKLLCFRYLVRPINPFSGSGTDADLSDTTLPFIIPGEPGNLIFRYPEGSVCKCIVLYVLYWLMVCFHYRYNPDISGPSGTPIATAPKTTQVPK